MAAKFTSSIWLFYRTCRIRNCRRNQEPGEREEDSDWRRYRLNFRLETFLLLLIFILDWK